MFCLSITVSWQPKCFHVWFKTNWRIRKFTDFVTRFSVAICLVHHCCSFTWSVEVCGAVRMMGTHGADGNCSSYFSLLRFTAAKPTLLAWQRPAVCNRLMSTATLRHYFWPRYCKIANCVTSPLNYLLWMMLNPLLLHLLCRWRQQGGFQIGPVRTSGLSAVNTVLFKYVMKQWSCCF